ncbi:sulfite reductase subunit alpha [Gilvimarinus chinensis]|uniref:sulfite reductase subunit alpha n=1 Tax=Gilvimarinus chinensis TaxID=396005 RepID=UPI00036019BA|nr:sulfite reductase subunit alpha [Gilvimarinus chinensis]
MAELERIALAVMLALLFLLFTWFSFHRHHKRNGAPDSKTMGDLVVAYASQSGRAHALAEQCANGFSGKASLLSLNQLTPQHLSQIKTLLVFASTYGEGEAPDNGALFEKALQPKSGKEFDIKPFQFAVIALGDSYYTDFCSFGYRIHSELEKRLAKPLMECITLDASAPEQEHTALLQVQKLVQDLGGEFYADKAEKNVIAKRYTVSLQSRKHLNKNSPGAGLYWLELSSTNALHYSAGDIAEVFPRQNLSACHAQLTAMGITVKKRVTVNGQSLPVLNWLASRQWPLPEKPEQSTVQQWLQSLPEVAPRQYTIANAFKKGSLELVVRQNINEQGELGLASGWLTEQLEEGAELDIAIRDNQEFHTPPAEQPLILIGNGSGIAGLRAHLQHRSNTGGEPCWLLYGERNAKADRPFAKEVTELQTYGVIQQLDLVFSRNGEQSEYVQDRLRQRSDLLLQWLERNACIYVCGSRKGMGQGVHDALQALVGEERLQQLQAQGRYRRDVY